MIDLKFLADKHRELDFLIENNKDGQSFISDWNCIHPFYKRTFEKIKIRASQHAEYKYIRGEDDLTTLIASFHSSNKEPNYLLNEILTSNGSTTIISAFFVWLKSKKIKEVYYIPPIYFTFHFFSKTYGISLRPITKSHLYEKNPTINFPNKEAILLITDPIWYSGSSVPEEIVSSLSKWQEATKSLIFVDGSFQYFKWDQSKYELTSVLNRERTLRLVCPTKAIAMHGLRFSYLLLPESLYNTFDLILDNLTGSSSPYDIAFAKECMILMNSEKSNTQLITYTEDIYNRLQKGKLIHTEIQPSSGYFIFARLKAQNKNFRVMDGKYFEQKKFKDYVRINLLGSAINELV